MTTRTLHPFLCRPDAEVDRVVTLVMPDGRCSLTVTRRGDLRYSDNAPEELIRYARDCMPRFHEAEVETAEVATP